MEPFRIGQKVKIIAGTWRDETGRIVAAWPCLPVAGRVASCTYSVAIDDLPNERFFLPHDEMAPLARPR